jgi:RNA-directed DNA polymerase
LVRYADDFVILCKSRRVLLGVLKHLKSYVGSIGPALNPGKTRFIHVKQGFKFLGFHVIRHPGRTVWIEPAKSSMKRHVRNLKPLFKIHAQSKSDDLITRLNYGIRGWSNYYRYSRAYIAFGKLDTILARRVLYWCGRRHPKKNKAWIKKKYFAGDSWTLHGENLHLARYYQTRRSRYRWRVGSRSFLDPRAREAWKQPFIDPTSSFLHMIDALS